MANLGSEVNQNGLPRENFGLPSLNLDECNRDSIPSDWEITDVFGDILMCEFVDENVNGEVMRTGIWVKQDITQHLWRIVRVLKVGPNASDRIKEGDCVMIPGDKGIRGLQKDGRKVIFINEPRLFAKVKPRDLLNS